MLQGGDSARRQFQKSNTPHIAVANLYPTFIAASLFAVVLSTIPIYWVIPPGVDLAFPPLTLYVFPFLTFSLSSELESDADLSEPSWSKASRGGTPSLTTRLNHLSGEYNDQHRLEAAEYQGQLTGHE